MDELHRPDAATYQASAKFPIKIMLDNVRSMQNVGAAFRTADSLGIEAVILGGITPCPPHRDIHKTALGAEETVQWHYAADVAQALKQLQVEGYNLIAVEQVHHSIALGSKNHPVNQKTVYVFGNEVSGVSDEALALCNEAIEIPQFGTKHSLNISVTVGIVLWEAVRTAAIKKLVP